MKTLTASLVLALTMMASTSHAFCLKAYMQSLQGASSLRDSSVTNFVPNRDQNQAKTDQSQSQSQAVKIAD